MRTFLAVMFGKLARLLIRLVRPGGGSALPGVIANKIQPKLLANAIKSIPGGLVVISGSAGKSSTTSYLVSLLQSHGLRVFTNTSTANIRQGLVAAILAQSDLRGRIDFDIAVLEWDEGHGAVLAKELPIKLAVLTNVLSDQLDRFVDPEVVIEMLKTIGSEAESVLINAEDKNLCQLDFGKSPLAFGADRKQLPPDELSYALNFGPHPALSHFVTAGASSVTVHGLGRESVYETLALPRHQAMNLAAAVAALELLVEVGPEIVQSRLLELKPVFARNEPVVVADRQIDLRLVQNPTSFQKNLDELVGDELPLMLMAGRDIHDPSWLWTVDFSKLNRVEIVGGFNASDLALRLRFQGVEVGQVITEATEAGDVFLRLSGARRTVLFSADAMRRVRRHWGLAK